MVQRKMFPMIEGIQQYEESGIKNGEDSWTLHEGFQGIWHLLFMEFGLKSLLWDWIS